MDVLSLFNSQIFKENMLKVSQRSLQASLICSKHASIIAHLFTFRSLHSSPPHTQTLTPPP